MQLTQIKFMEPVKYLIQVGELREEKDGKVVGREGDVVELPESFTQENIDTMLENGLIAVATPIATYIVTQEHIDTNPAFAELNVPVGTEVSYDPASVISRDEAVKAGIPVEKIEKENKVVEEEAAPEPVAEAVAPVLMYRGKVIVSSGTRLVGDQMLQQIKLESGETLDLTEVEYATEVKTA